MRGRVAIECESFRRPYQVSVIIYYWPETLVQIIIPAMPKVVVLTEEIYLIQAPITYFNTYDWKNGMLHIK
jgi:hypothetical protein